MGPEQRLRLYRKNLSQFSEKQAGLFQYLKDEIEKFETYPDEAPRTVAQNGRSSSSCAASCPVSSTPHVDRIEQQIAAPRTFARDELNRQRRAAVVHAAGRDSPSR